MSGKTMSPGKREGDVLPEALNTDKYSLDETGDEIRNDSNTVKDSFRLAKINL
ncbi:hypothetical protein [Rheinheimera sediminis]|uniref:hypothetical protein n=1 Tax=Rheinheimera sp. YQF-1 TaxID=2499626 RepID=UPI001647C3DB|nr:hypothetical protein [Rheinheimera sp. YQF-1]